MALSTTTTGGLHGGSGRRRGFRVVAQADAEGLGECDQGDVAVPAEVAAAFEVVDLETVFEFAVVVFDAPADLGQAHQSAWGVGGQAG
jgi:hypothetical protein